MYVNTIDQALIINKSLKGISELRGVGDLQKAYTVALAILRVLQVKKSQENYKQLSNALILEGRNKVCLPQPSCGKRPDCWTR